MAFDEVRLPDNVERGAKGGPRFKTTVLPLASGFEKRNIDWAEARGDWDVGYGIDTKENLEAVIAFFWARQGRARGFRFKDWSDFEIEAGNIGTGDGAETAFQVRKQYVSGLVTYNRLITKLVSGTLTVYFDGVEQLSGYTVDNDTGIITFAPAVPNNVVITVDAQFDVPVRFDTDKLDVSMEVFNAGEVNNIPIIELRQA